MKAAPDRKDFRLDIKNLDDSGEIEGMGAVFGNVDQGGDIVDPGAFTETLKAHQAKGTMPKMLWQHDPSQVIGVWESMAVRDEGLHVKGRLIKDVEKGREAYTLLKNRAMDGLSIGYATKDFEYEGDGRVRRLKEIELWEVSVVTFPMNTEATVTGVKKMSGDLREAENALREAGFSKTAAKLIARWGYPEAMKRLDTDARREADSVSEAEAFAGLLTQLHALEDSLNGPGAREDHR